MTTFEMYLMFRIDSLRECIQILLMLSIILFIGSIIVKNEKYEIEPTKIKADMVYKRTFIMIIVCTALFIILPTSKEIAALYVVPKLLKNEKVSAIPDKFFDWINAKFSVSESKESK